MAAPVLEVRNLTKRFGALLASDAVSLTLRPGEIHALIGPNGAGKSSLIKQIVGELAPDAGEIRLAGAEIGGLSAAARARAGLARSFQTSTLALELTALENVMLAIIGRAGAAMGFFRAALRDAALTAEARGHLERVGLAQRAEAPAAILAHGERRLLELAIALALKPKAFLLDEPTAGLGESGSKAITRFLSDLRHEAPILLIEHDMDAVFALADRISVLVYGRILASGSVDEIRADRAVREAYLGAAAAL